MRTTSQAGLTLVLPLVICGLIAGGDATPSGTRQPPAYSESYVQVTPAPYVQITSVTVEPSTIHKTLEPNTATVTVQIMLIGQAPPNSTVKVEALTSSSDPPGNNVRYSKIQTVPLKKGDVTVVKFKAEASPQTVKGKLIVTAAIDDVTDGVNVKDPWSPKDSEAELKTLDP